MDENVQNMTEELGKKAPSKSNINEIDFAYSQEVIRKM